MSESIVVFIPQGDLLDAESFGLVTFSPGPNTFKTCSRPSGEVVRAGPWVLDAR